MQVALDLGNSAFKAYEGESNIPVLVQSGVYQLDDMKSKNLLDLNQGNIPEGYIVVNNAMYAIGEQAESYNQIMLRGGDRYTPNFYGVAMCYMVSQIIEQGVKLEKRVFVPNNIEICGLMPPRDFAEHKNALVNNVGKKSYRVKTAKSEFTLNASNFIVRPEPLAGYCHARFTKEMRPKSNLSWANKPIIVFDSGGFTSDVAAIHADGTVNFGILGSETIGVMNLLREGEQQLRKQYKGVFGSASLPRKKLESMLQTGVYMLGTHELDASQIADNLLNNLSNNAARLIQNAGGQGSFETLLLTGGGGALLQSRLQTAFPYMQVVLAEEPDFIQMANVVGAYKMLRGEGMVKKIKARGR